MQSIGKRNDRSNHETWREVAATTCKPCRLTSQCNLSWDSRIISKNGTLLTVPFVAAATMILIDIHVNGGVLCVAN